MLRAVLLIDLSGTNHLSLTAKYRGDSKGITFFTILLCTTVAPHFYLSQLNPD
jgi:hypothetical protein